MSDHKLEDAAFDAEATFEVEDYMYFYSDMLKEASTERQLAFLVDALDLHAPPELPVPLRILDLACGFGRHANRLAAMGHQVVGVDLMEGFLQLARQDAQARGVTVDYRQGDMRQIDFEQEFDRVLLMFTAFGYFSDEENALVLSKVARALKPGGLFVMDIHNRDMFLKDFLPEHVTEKEGNLMIDRITFDSLTGRLHNRRIVIRNGVRKDKPYSVRMYNPSEIKALLETSGLQIQQFCSDWEGNPISTESRRMIIIARK
ncbi:MAG: class I SAM-dependent methyltransferase [Chloroflexota bacterium]